MPIQRKGMRALQIWCARVTSGYASVEVTDLTSSFRSGLAFVGIIHHFRPDLIQSPDSLDPKDVVGNNALAYRYEFNTCENLSISWASHPLQGDPEGLGLGLVDLI